MRIFEFQQETLLPRSREEIIPFFSDARNLQAITPPWLHFKILTPEPIVLQTGALIDYQLRVHGVPLRWRTCITCWDPPHEFVDEQLRGPYRLWRHRHTFEDCDGHTLMRDRVSYAVLGGSVVNRWLVRPDVERIFDYRQQRIRQLFNTGPQL